MHPIPPRLNPILKDISNVLVISDHKEGYVELATYLGSGFKFSFLDNPELTNQHLLGTDTDLILVDENVGTNKGIDICKKIKLNQISSTIPLIFAGSKNNALEEQVLMMGAIDYISIPFHLPIVKARIHNYVNLKKKIDLLESLSNLDGLTNIPNRRYFNDSLLAESHRLCRSNKPLGIIMIDIDFFKDFNDYYGHSMGDDCLKKVAWIMQKSMPHDYDLLARYGGEEFVVLLPNRDLTQCCLVAESLKKAVEQLHYPNKPSKVSDFVTISLGVSSEILTTPEMGADLVKRADIALYQAKRHGRNRCVMDATASKSIS
jgi:diguanylate cyclase (GGDEF)-like protein